MVKRDFRSRQILCVLGLNAGKQRHALKIIGKFRKLLADSRDGFKRLV